jgi:signal transduction histidine kinase
LLFRNNGDNFPAEYWCYPIIHDGKTIGSVVTFLDITERKHIEKEADEAKQKLLEQQQHQTDLSQQELEKIKEQLIRHSRLSTVGLVAANIADELRHPLGAVRNAAYYMKRHLVNDNSKIAQFKDITGQVNDVSDQIINNLLEMTRAKEPIKRTIDLGDIVREGIERSHFNNAIKCQLEFEEKPFMFFVDPTQFLKVIENLLSNAQQSIKGKGLITIQGWHTADIDFITVQDSGSGIGNNQVTKVFEPLFTTKAKGTGLGLNISRQIIEQHGGSLEYVEQDGTGAMFEVQLPRVLI